MSSSYYSVKPQTLEYRPPFADPLQCEEDTIYYKISLALFATFALVLSILLWNILSLRAQAAKLFVGRSGAHVRAQQDTVIVELTGEDILGLDDSPDVDVQQLIAAPSTSLFGVSVRRVRRALDGPNAEPVSTVMKSLWTGIEYLEPVFTAEGGKRGSLAIISYRMVPADDGFTLDAESFLSVLRCAEREGISFLWLDCWAYRKQPPWAPYVHQEFISTLTAVMLAIDLVIWLPRSRSYAKGQYQYRVWCTFEALMVQARQKPVIIAGHDLTSMQLAIGAWGSYLITLPWWRDGSPVVRLGIVNFAFYTFTCSILPIVLVMGLLATPEITIIWFGTWVFGLCFWLWRRGQGLGVMMASNGSSVLRTMLSRAAGRPSHTMKMSKVLRTLPWLPAFDRRDIITCKAVLENVQQHLHGTAPSKDTDAFAASIYAAALLMPAPGDAIKKRCARAWLAEIGITLYEDKQLTNHLAEEVSSSLQVGSQEQGSTVPKADWLDSVPRVESASSTTSESQPIRNCNYDSTLTLSELQHLGWMRDVGLHTSFRTPAGTMLVSPRARSQNGQHIGAVKLLPPRRMTMAALPPTLLGLAITQFVRFVRFPCLLIAPFVTDTIAFNVTFIVAIGALLGDDLRSRQFPMPIPQSGRVEFCILAGAVAFILFSLASWPKPYYVVKCVQDGHGRTNNTWKACFEGAIKDVPDYVSTSSDDCALCGTVTRPGAEEYLSGFVYYLLGGIAAAYMAFVSGVHSLVAATRYRNWRYLFAITAHGRHEARYPAL